MFYVNLCSTITLLQIAVVKFSVGPGSIHCYFALFVFGATFFKHLVQM